MIKNGHSLQEFEVDISENGHVFYHSTVIDKNGFPISGGFGSNKKFARKVAISEFVERLEISKIRGSDVRHREEWGLHIIPTACGFAVGYNKDNTCLRSLGESLERWVASLWIDEHFYIDEMPSKDILEFLDPASLFFVRQFDHIRYFKKRIVIEVQSKHYTFEVVQTMAYKDDGIFPGSSVRNIEGSIWQHALVESYRHLLAHKNNPLNSAKFPANKVDFFSKNKSIANTQIKKAHKKKWPVPSVIFHRVEPIFNGELFIARTIIDGWKSWDQGPLERFLF